MAEKVEIKASRVQRGRKSINYLQKLKDEGTALADFYGVSVDYLLGRTACRIKLENYQKPIVAGYSASKSIEQEKLN